MLKIYSLLFVFTSITFILKGQEDRFITNWQQQVNQILERYNDQPGIALGITQADQTIYNHSSGLSNLDYNIQIDEHSVFDVAAVSKQFTAYCIYHLAQNGKLNLDDPITNYLPEMPKYKEGTATIRHLIHNTSGLRSYRKLMYLIDQNFDFNYKNEDCLSLLYRQRKPNFAPGSRYAYSNTGYVLLAEIIENVSGQSLAEYAKENIFEPIGMKSTFFSVDRNEVIKNRAIGYALNEDSYQRMHYFDAKVIGDGGVHTTLKDMLIWNIFFQKGLDNKYPIIEKLLQRGSLSDGTEVSYAGGLIHNSIQGMRTLGHEGEWGGFRSIQLRLLDEKISFTLLSNNAEINLWAILYEIIGILYPVEEEMEPENKSPQLSQTKVPFISSNTNDLTKFQGHYFNPIQGYSRSIELIRDTLYYVRSNASKSMLQQIGENTFSFVGVDQLTLKIYPADNKMLFEINGQTDVEFEKYEPAHYSESELVDFEGEFYCSDLQIKYTINAKPNALEIFKGSKFVVALTPVMENVFNEVHFGYVKFKKIDGVIHSFTINDELVNDIEFVRA